MYKIMARLRPFMCAIGWHYWEYDYELEGGGQCKFCMERKK